MTDFHGCYKERWQGEITPEAFSHPAKVSRGLARKIYAYIIEQGWLKPGDTCLDPFAGIGGFALDALANGLNWFGVELEQNFVDMGAGCDCTGISKADWVACFGRWKRFAHKDGRHWCPRCLAEAGQIIKERKAPKLTQAQARRRARMRELIARTGRKIDFSLYVPIPFSESRNRQTTKAARLFGTEALAASYERSSGKIPHTEPHRYIGNLDLFARHARNGATAVLVQGDSRRLVEVLEGARAEGIVASPPFASSIGLDGGASKRQEDYGHIGSWGKDYGTDPAQLGNMPTGEPPQAVIGSPPHGVAGVGHDAGHPRLDATEDARREAEGCKCRPAYGESDGQLAAMREGDVDAVIASPPYATQTVHDRCGVDPNKLTGNPPGPHSQVFTMSNYGDSDGQLAAMREGDMDAVIASPPYSKSFAGGGEAIQPRPGDIRKHARKMTLDESYGASDGQLAALPEGEPPAGIVSSPPWETTNSQFASNTGARQAIGDWADQTVEYGQSNGQIGNTQGDTFWSASRAILLQCHQVLAPGGVAIWVLKAFVRNKAIVDFPGQWETLCNSCGFETMEVIRAWLIEDRGTQFALNGDLVKKKVARKSFFRRLHESKYPNLAIDYEVMLVTRKI